MYPPILLREHHKPKISQFQWVYLALLRQPHSKKWKKNSFEMIIIIIISLTTNFIAAFHGLYLLAAHSHSFQFLLPFVVEHMKKGLCMDNVKQKTLKKQYYGYIEHNITVHLLTTTGNVCMLLKNSNLIIKFNAFRIAALHILQLMTFHALMKLFSLTQYVMQN